MSGTQVAVRLTVDDVGGIDALIAEGRFGSRAEAVRSAVEVFLDQERRRAEGGAIAEGYRRIPQTPAEVARAESNLRRLIEEEPW